jgi:hypothetical protein
MKGVILLNHNDNTRIVEEEEKSRFLRSIIDEAGVPQEQLDFWTMDAPLSIEQQLKLKGLFSTYGIQTIDDRAGELKIYMDNKLVAEWHKPTYKLKKDLSQLDRRKRIYLEMTVSCWSLFEEEEIPSPSE